MLSDDSARSRRARDELLAIRDAGRPGRARRNLQNRPSEAARRIYVAILRQIPGEDSTGLLVAQSLGDPSRRVRSEAGSARCGAGRCARRLYIDCLLQRLARVLRSCGAGTGGNRGSAARFGPVPHRGAGRAHHAVTCMSRPGRLATASAWMRWSRPRRPKCTAFPSPRDGADVLSCSKSRISRIPSSAITSSNGGSGSPNGPTNPRAEKFDGRNEEFAVTSMRPR